MRDYLTFKTNYFGPGDPMVPGSFESGKCVAKSAGAANGTKCALKYTTNNYDSLLNNLSVATGGLVSRDTIQAAVNLSDAIFDIGGALLNNNFCESDKCHCPDCGGLLCTDYPCTAEEAVCVP